MICDAWMCSDTDLVQRYRSATGRTMMRKPEPSRSLSAGVAIIEVRGLLTKYGSPFGISTVETAAEVRRVAANPSIATIALLVDTPGGHVAGTDALADAVFQARRTKHVVAFVEDLCASGGYYVASQANQVFANRTALVGSIGTYLVAVDASQLAERMGVKVHVVRAGEFKGTGTFGAEITDDQLADMQRVIDTTNDHFVAAVARGRGLPEWSARALADGRVHVGKEAQRLGLIDGLSSLSLALPSLVEHAASRLPKISAPSYSRNSHGFDVSRY